MQRLRAPRHWLLPLLLVAMQAMQATGLRHRVEHADIATWNAAALAAAAAASYGVDAAHGAMPSTNHDCASMDQHTLGGSAPPVWAAPGCPNADVRRVAKHLARPLISADARPFDARAPPLPLC